jgi:hypothetical protein
VENEMVSVLAFFTTLETEILPRTKAWPLKYDCKESAAAENCLESSLCALIEIGAAKEIKARSRIEIFFILFCLECKSNHKRVNLY